MPYGNTLPSCRLIRLTSPNLNYLIGFGVIVFNMAVYFFVYPQVPHSALLVICNVSGSAAQYTLVAQRREGQLYPLPPLGYPSLFWPISSPSSSSGLSHLPSLAYLPSAISSPSSEPSPFLSHVLH